MKIIIPMLLLGLLSACGGGSGSSTGETNNGGARSTSSSANSSSSEPVQTSSSSKSSSSSIVRSSSLSSATSSSFSSSFSSNSPISSSSSSSSSSNSSSSSSANTDLVPTDLRAGAGNKQIRLDWQKLDNTDSYNVFFASEPNIDPLNIGAYADGDWQQAVQPPIAITGLDNHKTYYLVVTANHAGGESQASPEISATPSAPTAALGIDGPETLMVELVNRARSNPKAEAARFGIELNEGLAPGTLTDEQRPPLAFNERLMSAARKHSQWMFHTGIFSHTGAGGSTSSARIAAEGYTLTGSWATGENISVKGSLPALNLGTAVKQQHQGLFKSSGHRKNILNASFRELGVGQRSGDFEFSQSILPSSMITQNFARHGSDYFVSGVVYRDSDNNGFYSVGEGINKVTVSAGNASTVTNSSGAYTIARGNGTYTVSAFGAGIDLVSAQVTIANANKKVNVIVSGSSSQLTQW